MMEQYYAHSGQRPDRSDWQPLRDHLLGTADLARKFAEAARPGDEEFAQAAYVAGLLHDLGKYRLEFQEMIRGKRAKGESTRHKQIGAAHACNSKWIDIAFAILGHHGGTPDKADLVNTIAKSQQALADVWPVAKSDCPEITTSATAWLKGVDPLLIDLRIRLLFSCLVDSDWLDTSNHEASCLGQPIREEPLPLDAGNLLNVVRAYIECRAAKCRDQKIAQIRSDVLQVAVKAAEEKPGLFTMTVPTGGGKTLSSLAFALEHAMRHGLRRIIYVAPYLSIIEQNARVFCEALGDQQGKLILEHHSMAEPMGPDGNAPDPAQAETAQRLAENWDAPVVLTTSVQFYETLFSNEPGRCRKLHNIARSVVILDECQSLPPGLTAPTCQMLQQICNDLGCTLVLCTATQPAWKRDERLLPQGLENVREIVPASLDLFQRLKRVRVTWPTPDSLLDWPTVAKRMLERQQALCVVNTKKAARNLFAELRLAGAENVFHLSTAMCPAHRLQILDNVRALLDQKQSCHLVSTQLIEAGVDVDFPLVLREIAPLECIVQAAGRCNREGLLNSNDGLPGGEVIVFRSIDWKMMPLDAWYRNGTAIVAQDFLRAGCEPDINCPADLAKYYRHLYPTGDLDQKQIMGLRKSFSFKDVAKQYRLIEESTTSLVVATWKAAADEIERLLSDIRKTPSRQAYRQLQRYAVNVYEHDLRTMKQSRVVVMDHLPGVNLCYLPYDDALGLVPQNGCQSLVT